MSVTGSSQNLSIDIKDFIQLLQRNQANAEIRRKQSIDSDKLSIIYSASQPESSLADKENSHNSANKSPSAQEVQEMDFLFKEIKRLGLTSQQMRHLDRLDGMATEMKKNVTICESKLRILEEQFEQQKYGTDEILKALIKIEEDKKGLWKKYSDLQKRYVKLEDEYQIIKKQNQNLQRQVCDEHENVEFMRKLVLVANQNYEDIQRKCKNLQKNRKMLERFQRSSPEITSRSQIGSKKSPCSPAISERSNVSANKGAFEDNYKKLVLRTLKIKAIR